MYVNRALPTAFRFLFVHFSRIEFVPLVQLGKLTCGCVHLSFMWTQETNAITK